MQTSLELLRLKADMPPPAIAGYPNHSRRTRKNGRRTNKKDAILKTSPFGDPASLHQAKAECAQAQSARIKAEKAASKADASNKAKSDFLADMSHEIRTPLGAIVGLARHLMTTQLDGKQKDCLAMLQGCADDLMGMLNHSLDIDKIESGTICLEHTSFSMHELLGNIVGVMSVKSREKDIRLTFHHAAGNGQTFIGDSGRIRQILVNLIGNAIKFTKIGGVDVSLVLGDEENGKQALSIAVADTGIGIGPDKLEAVFERFSQADHSILRRFGGTGLGLSIAKALAESMGGALGVTSIPGKGSVFTLNLHLALSKDATKSINHLSIDQSQMNELKA